MDSIRRVLQLQRVEFEAKYMCLPTLRRGVLRPMEERFVKRIVSWKERDLSSVAKDILIKLVAVWWSDESYIRAFWWGSEMGLRKVQWVPWQTMIMHLVSSSVASTRTSWHLVCKGPNTIRKGTCSIWCARVMPRQHGGLCVISGPLSKNCKNMKWKKGIVFSWHFSSARLNLDVP